MKKLAISLILGASLAVTPSAFALKAMSATNMKDATGQAGVSIALDDVTIYQSVGSTTYTDTDGLGTTGSAAASLVVGGKETLTTYRAILDDTHRGGFLQMAYGSATLKDGTTPIITDIVIAPLSIDVAHKAVSLSAGMAFNHRNDVLDLHTAVALADYSDTTDTDTNGVTDNVEAVATALGLDILDAVELATAEAKFSALAAVDAGADADARAATSYTIAKANVNAAAVVIGLPTLEIVKTGDTQTIGLASEGSVNDGKNFIQITKSQSVMAILSGTVEIAAH